MKTPSASDSCGADLRRPIGASDYTAPPQPYQTGAAALMPDGVARGASRGVRFRAPGQKSLADPPLRKPPAPLSPPAHLRLTRLRRQSRALRAASP